MQLFIQGHGGRRFDDREASTCSSSDMPLPCAPNIQASDYLGQILYVYMSLLI